MKIERSGLIPFHVEDGQIKMMFMQPSDPLYGGPDFQIAKGKIEVGESELETAIRESNEELGLRQDNILHTFYCGKFLGRTHVFAAIVQNKEDFDDFDNETGAVKWMTLAEFLYSGRDIHHDVVQAAYDEIVGVHLSDQL